MAEGIVSLPTVAVLDAATMVRWAGLSCSALGAAAAEIDAINVFPVPDGDTGTNLYLTMCSAVAALDPLPDEVGRHHREEHPGDLALVLDRLSRGALAGARGNSGVILSQLLRGLADSLGRAQPAGGPALARALSHAVDLAYLAVAAPVEGTILTVARGAADAALAVQDVPARLDEVTRAAAAGAVAALARTPDQLAVLAEAGVVDAGGRGLCVLLDALLATVTGTDVVPAVPNTAPAVRTVSGVVSSADADRHGSGGFGYEVQFLLDQADDSTVRVMRAELAGLGDSLVVVDSGGSDLSDDAEPDARFWSVHVHVDDVGAAIEAGVRAGRPHRITVVRFADQTASSAAGRPDTGHAPCALEDSPPSADRAAGAAWTGRAVVALSSGPLLADLFSGEGVHVVTGGIDHDPPVTDVVSAIRRTEAAEVVVLANDASLTGIADAAARQAREAGQDVAVVPTKSVIQGLAAVAVADATRRFPDDVISMAEAAAATRWAEVSIAEEEAMTSAGRCAAGAILGLAEGDVVLIGTDQVQVACDLLDRLLSAGGELVTMVLSGAAVPDFASEVRSHLRHSHRGVELVDYLGGRMHPAALIGVE